MHTTALTSLNVAIAALVASSAQLEPLVNEPTSLAKDEAFDQVGRDISALVRVRMDIGLSYFALPRDQRGEWAEVIARKDATLSLLTRANELRIQANDVDCAELDAQTAASRARLAASRARRAARAAV